MFEGVELMSEGIKAQVAQLVERWTENPFVIGSIPVLGNDYIK